MNFRSKVATFTCMTVFAALTSLPALANVNAACEGYAGSSCTPCTGAQKQTTQCKCKNKPSQIETLNCVSVGEGPASRCQWQQASGAGGAGCPTAATASTITIDPTSPVETGLGE